MQASGTSSTKIACFLKLAQAAHLEALAPIGALKRSETILAFANAVRLGVGVIEYNREGKSNVSAPASRAARSMRFRHRGDSAIRQQGSHAVVSGFRTRFPPEGSRDRGYRPRISSPRTKLLACRWHRRTSRNISSTVASIGSAISAANAEIEGEIAALYQGKAVPHGQSDALTRPPRPCAATLARGEIKMQ